ncbi:hypothetical protein B0H17DRAFT_922954 [Mycena rosella]|uniref:Uncharacterized protein n=1 Tax=Mycena rosella TaxID=1033263 RepID=A0AAD7GQ82_MYCRO|nr:hypothetical protein B0H17DRAFT_922954 [Mycena rosella]
MEAITVLGLYDYKERGQLVSWEDSGMVEVRPGSMLLFPAGTKGYSFVAVALHETRYLFRQFCHGSILRWVEKGGRSDSEWEEFLSPQDLEAWRAARPGLAAASLKSFTKISDIYVL